jgi:hypothetical protein
VKLIFLAASNLAQLMQRPSPGGNPIEKTGRPQFLHLAGTVIGTSFMNISSVADYKEEAGCPGLTNRSPQNGPPFNGLQKTHPIVNSQPRQIGMM